MTTESAPVQTTRMPQDDAGPATPSGSRGSPAWMGWLLSTGFVALAAILMIGSREGRVSAPPAVHIDRANLAVGPRRAAMGDPPHITVDGLAQSCNGCHQIFPFGSPAEQPLSFHQVIQLRHGLNNRCVNCHDPNDLQRLTLRDGAAVPFAETPRLCSQCHGTVYRDWQRGTHGKTLGSWITHSEAQRRLSCNECHDPHSPKYEPYPTLPGPNTLRMGDQGRASHHEEGPRPSPLQKWLGMPGPHSPPPDGGQR